MLKNNFTKLLKSMRHLHTRQNGKSTLDLTTDYYDLSADEFSDATKNLDVEHLYKPFLTRLPVGAKILDAGCGSGRDALAFKQRGFSVTAFDASAPLVDIAKKHSGIEVLQMRFQDMHWRDEFDGIWACASLLHVPKSEMDGVMEKIICALK